MEWVTFANIHGIEWRVEEDPRLNAKIYRFKKDDKRIYYYIPLITLANTQRKLLEAELLRVIRGLV